MIPYSQNRVAKIVPFPTSDSDCAVCGGSTHFKHIKLCDCCFGDAVKVVDILQAAYGPTEAAQAVGILAPRTPLSDLQRHVYSAICEFWLLYDRSPSRRELYLQSGINSRENISRIITTLTIKGWLWPRRPRAARALRPVDLVGPKAGRLPYEISDEVRQQLEKRESHQ